MGPYLVGLELDTVVTVSWIDGLVTSIQMVRNPDTLAAMAPPAGSDDRN